MKIILIFLMTIVSSAHASEFKTNYLTFLLTERSSQMSHDETSPDGSFTTLGKTLTIPTISLRVAFEKEFLAEQSISFTPWIYGGGMLGRNTGDIVSRNLQYSDKASGTLYGAGGSVNANFKLLKTMRLQPFGGLHFMKSSSKYKLTYYPMYADLPKVNVDYKEDGTQSFLTAGLRIFDFKQELFSVISIDYQLSSSFTSNSFAKLNDRLTSFTQETKRDFKPLGFSLGFGMMF